MSLAEAWMLVAAVLVWGTLIGVCLTLVLQRFFNPTPGRRRREE